MPTVPDRRRRRRHRVRQDRPLPRPRRAARRRDRQHRRHAGLPRHGHRHRQAAGRRAARHPAPPARPARRHASPPRSRSSRGGRARPIAELRGRGADAGPGRRLGALHPRDHRPLRVPRHRRGRPRRGWRRELDRARARRRCTTGCATVDPEAAGRILARQRAPHRPRPRGRRAHRPALHRHPADPGVRRPAHRPDRRRHRPADPRRADRAAGRGDVRGRLRRGGRAPARPRAWPRAAPRRGRSATARWRRTSPATCTLAEAREQTVQATRRFARRQDVVVPQGPAHRLGAVRRPRPGRAGARGRPGSRARRDPGRHGHHLLHRLQPRRLHRGRGRQPGLALRAGHRHGGPDGLPGLRRGRRRPGDGRDDVPVAARPRGHPGAGLGLRAADLGVHPPHLPRGRRGRAGSPPGTCARCTGRW